MLDLASECKNLEVLSHVSTAYVCSNQPNKSKVLEEIGDDYSNMDWEEQIKKIEAMDRNEIVKNEKQLICGHVFGYTYVKSLAERHLARYGKKLKIVINRPSMVIHTCKEPFPGWIDTISAVGTVSYPLGMGFLKTYYLPNGYRDFIPADIVSNSIIVSTAYIGQQKEPCF
jgi:fatty acyl-CoA reductase